MKNSYEKLLGLPCESMAARIDPTDRLCQRVMNKVEHRELALARGRTLGFGLVLIFVVAALIPAVTYLSSASKASGLGQYISLLLSDSSYVMSHWQDLAFSITESLPIMAIVMIVALLLIGLSSLRWFMRYQGYLSDHLLTVHQ